MEEPERLARDYFVALPTARSTAEARLTGALNQRAKAARRVGATPLERAVAG